MITTWDIYWITRLDSILFGSRFVAIFSVVLTVVFSSFLVMCIVENAGYVKSEKSNKYWEEEIAKNNGYIALIKRALAFFIPILVLSSTISAVVPDTKEAVAIWALPKIVNNEDVQKIPANFAKLVNDALQDWMKDVNIVESKGESK